MREEWKRQKIKLSHVDAKDLTKAAIDYLEAHPELVEEAELVQHLGVTQRKRRPDLPAFLLCKYQTQKGGSTK